jgi:hypothetical protein
MADEIGKLSSYEYSRKTQQDALKFQLDFTEVLERTRKYLEGYYWDDTDNKYTPFSTDVAGNVVPLMNSRGIALVMRTLVGLAHKGTVLANITPEEAQGWALMIHRSIAKTLFIHADEIGVAPSDLREITMNVSLTVYHAFTRALNGDAAEKLNQIVTVHEEKSSGERKGVF